MKFRKTILGILAQILPVMLGVYLAFALNNYGENKSLEKDKSHYLELLKNEISINKKEIEGVIPYHLQLQEDFSEILKSKSIKEWFDNNNFGGIRPGFTNQSAYETGMQTGLIQHFDLKFIQQINSLYNLQDGYQEFNKTVINSFVNRKFPETEKEMESLLISMVMNLNDINSFEKRLISFYDSVLEEM